MNPLSSAATPLFAGLALLAPPGAEEPEDGRRAGILSPEACGFLAGLFRAFGPRRKEILLRRAERRRGDAAGGGLDFPPETAAIRAGEWRVPPPPPDLLDRRTEITGPVDRETAVRALTSGARCYMADLEDFTSPTWGNVLDAQASLREAVRRTLRWPGGDGPSLGLEGDLATLHVRPRGWHLPEKHLLFEGEPAPAALVDFGLAFFHNAGELVARGSGPYFYLPKLEGHLEARLWRDVFFHSEVALGLPGGTVRATAMIETLPAVFVAEEILYELGPYALALNCGRWDYLFSALKELGKGTPPFPDRSRLTMEAPALRAYCRQVIGVCRRRGAVPLGGMAAELPIPGDEEGTRRAFALVRADKEREAALGFDGASVGHPDLVPLAAAAFAAPLPGSSLPGTGAAAGGAPEVTRAELLDFPTGPVTEAGVRLNLRVAFRYLAAWLGGRGRVEIDHRIEDAATAEISRSQLWQWLRRKVILEDGRPLTPDLYAAWLGDEMEKLAGEGGAERAASARRLLWESVTSPDLVDFLTVPAYDLLP